VRGKRAQPVLVTPIARHVFENGRAKDAHARYAAAIRNVAAETTTPLIDLDADSMAYLDRLGEEASKNLFLIYTPADRIPLWPEGHKDTTHFNERGARVGAALVAARLKALNLPVSRHVRPQGSDEPPVLGRPGCP
jgi:DNA sulfur modification protein DndE